MKLLSVSLGFYEKINGALSNVKLQALSLPFLLALIRIQSLEENIIVICFFIYAFIVYLSLFMQGAYIDNLKKEFERFYNKNSEISALADDINLIKKTFNNQLYWQWTMCIFLQIFIQLWMSFLLLTIDT